MNKTKTIIQNAFDCGMKRAKKQISQIKEIKDVVERIEKEKEAREIKMEIYQLLQKAKTLAQQEKALKAYFDGLSKVDAQDRLKYEIIWSTGKKDIEENGVDEAMIDRKNSQIIVTTCYEKSHNVYCFDLKTGKRNWLYKVRYEQAWTPFLGKDAFFFIPMKNHDSPSWSGDYVHAVSLKTGELFWKAQPNGDHESAEKIIGLFNDLLLVKGFKGLSALNIIDDGKEAWSCRYSARSKGFFKAGEILLLDIGKREIAWLSRDGKLLKEKTFGFRGFGDGAFIDLMEQDKDNLYVFVWDHGSQFAIEPKDRNKVKEALVIYCLDKIKKTLKWQIKIPEMRVQKMISQNNRLYMFSKEQRLIVVDKEKGKIIDELNYEGEAINQNLLFCTGPEDKDDDYSFNFFAIDLLNKKVKWQRKNFGFRALHQGLIYGREEKNLLVLNQNNGKERAKIKMNGEIQDVQFIDDNHFLVHGSDFICLIKQK